jgi:putative ABC transport system substrate-binding protein
MMERRHFLVGMSLAIPTALFAEAQQAEQIHRIGILPPGPIAERMHLWDAFRQGLRELGYTEGRNITLVFPSAEVTPELLSRLADELVRLKVEVIVAATTPAIQAAMNATTSIPIVMAVGADPVASGFVGRLASPGGNVTGQSIISIEMSGKRLALLKEAVPRVTRVAVLSDATSISSAPQRREMEVAAQALGLKLQVLEVRNPAEIEAAFRAAVKWHAGALIVVDSPFLFTYTRRIAALAEMSRLPMMSGLGEFAQAGGLVAYGPNIPDLYRRAATYVDMIFKGAKPADLPIEQPTKFELVINLKTAKALGLTIPQSLLLRADQVIE